MAENLFSRILRGTTKPKEDTKKAEAAMPTPALGAVEKVLNVPISRRSILGGAATTAGHLASSGAIPQAPIVIRQEVVQRHIPELLDTIIPNISQVLHFASHFTRVSENAPIRSFYREFPNHLQKDLPMDAAGRIDPHLYEHLIRAVDTIENGLSIFPQETKLETLKDEQLFNDAYKLSGNQGYVDVSKGDTAGAQVREVIQFVEQVTKLTDGQTIADVKRVLNDRMSTIARNIAHHPALMPPPGSEGRYGLLNNLRFELDKTDDVKLFEVVDRDFKQEFDLSQEKAWKRFQESAKESSKYLREQEAKRVERINTDVLERAPIRCRVEATVRERRDDADARVFFIRQEKPSSELTRMHVQHLRQQLTLDGVLDNFNPANTKVETIGSAIRVSTTDKKFQEYLSTFVGTSTLMIPNRLQMLVTQEKEEN